MLRPPTGAAGSFLLVLFIDLHQQRQHPVRQFLRRLVTRLELLPDLGLNGAVWGRPPVGQMAWFQMAWFQMAWFQMAWFQMAWFQMAWFQMAWFQMAWFQM